MDAPAPLSQSRVWELQRAFYEDKASEAFAEIPHQIVDNPFVAAAFARVVVGYLRDAARGGLDLDEPSRASTWAGTACSGSAAAAWRWTGSPTRSW